ncbi:class A beta-lactamase [Caulobacter sp. S45]|uniref:class A beta-lactamase n=1 Tax=Caulobacter sp. S45 TaxID=1641861 RepID=UPI001575EACB|nr:class A beta-lactamase [Caulobacter sp. S45]
MRGTAAATLDRRALLAAAPALILAAPVAAFAATPDFAALERATGGKLGVFVLDTGSARTLAWRADSRFPFCSSFKAPLAAFVLWKAERGALHLDQPVPYDEADLVGWSPVTRAHVAQGVLTVRELCAAAVDYSDNGAANLLLRLVGGPQALTAWMRQAGDPAFQLSHPEMQLNHSRFGDAIDTTTPRAMAESFRRLAFGDVLRPASRTRWIDWLVANTTGDKRLRAGLPAGWRVGDKTGTWNEGWFSTVDIAVAWPPSRPPLVIAGFVTDHPSTAAGEAALAEVARQVGVWEQARG